MKSAVSPLELGGGVEDRGRKEAIEVMVPALFLRRGWGAGVPLMTPAQATHYLFTNVSVEELSVNDAI